VRLANAGKYAPAVERWLAGVETPEDLDLAAPLVDKTLPRIADQQARIAAMQRYAEALESHSRSEQAAALWREIVALDADHAPARQALGLPAREPITAPLPPRTEEEPEEAGEPPAAEQPVEERAPDQPVEEPNGDQPGPNLAGAQATAPKTAQQEPPPPPSAPEAVLPAGNGLQTGAEPHAEVETAPATPSPAAKASPDPPDHQESSAAMPVFAMEPPPQAEAEAETIPATPGPEASSEPSEEAETVPDTPPPLPDSPPISQKKDEGTPAEDLSSDAPAEQAAAHLDPWANDLAGLEENEVDQMDAELVIESWGDEGDDEHAEFDGAFDLPEAAREAFSEQQPGAPAENQGDPAAISEHGAPEAAESTAQASRLDELRLAGPDELLRVLDEALPDPTQGAGIAKEPAQPSPLVSVADSPEEKSEPEEPETGAPPEEPSPARPARRLNVPLLLGAGIFILALVLLGVWLSTGSFGPFSAEQRLFTQWREQAETALAQGRYDDAQELTRRILQVRPDDPEALELQQSAAAGAQQLRAQLQAAAEREALFTRGLELFQKKQWQECREVMKQVLARAPDDANARLYLKELERILGPEPPPAQQEGGGK
jgi:tetratricopeptide (TPR) repeat protein